MFCTEYVATELDKRLGSGVHTDAIVGRILLNTIWVETGGYDVRERPGHGISTRAVGRCWPPTPRLRGTQRQYRWPPEAIFTGPQTRKYSLRYTLVESGLEWPRIAEIVGSGVPARSSFDAAW